MRLKMKKKVVPMKVIPVLVALVLIVVVAAVGFGSRVLDKYTYSKERADLDAYFEVDDGELAIILQDEMVEEKAVWRDDMTYFDLDTVSKYFNDGFYVDLNERKLLYTTANDTFFTLFDAKDYFDRGGGHVTGYVTCYLQGEKLYVAADYIKLFTNYSYDRYERQLQVYTQWGERETKEIVKDTQIRLLGGIKSPILRDVAEGETVELLEEMETWSKVKTTDAFIGYIENKRLANGKTEKEIPVADYVEEEYTSVSMPGKVVLGWHSIGGAAGNDTLAAVLAEGKGMNVIAPTWFSLTDNEGSYRSFASAQYVEKAHGQGLQVWGVWDDFNYKNETGADVDSYQVLSSTTKRQKLARDIVEASLAVGLDGVNIDFENISAECGVHFVQFLRELSVQCRDSGLVLSIDNYVPFHFNDYYRLDVQGKVADYVIIMGYDEHWHGSGDPGSVASISYVSNGLDRTLQQVPAEKVVNALPFYTILWMTEGLEVTDRYLVLNNVGEYLQRVGVEPEWDETACQNYAEWVSDGTTYQIWIEDLDSISAKLNVMGLKGIGGVAVWRLGYGTEEAWNLVSAFASIRE